MRGQTLWVALEKWIKDKNTIGVKLFFCMMLLVITSIVLMVSTVYSNASDAIRENEIRYNLLATNTIKSQFDMTTELIQEMARTYAANDVVQEYMEGSLDKREEAEGFITNTIVMQPFIEQVHLFDDDMLLYSSAPQTEWDRVRTTYESIKEQFAMPGNQGGFWSTRQISISYIVPIGSLPSSASRGSVVLEIDYDYLREMFMLSAIKLNEKVLVADALGNVLFNFPHYVSFEPFLAQYPELFATESLQMEGDVYGMDSIIVSEKLSLSDWRIVRIIQTDQITLQSRNMLRTTQITVGALLIVCLLFSLGLSRTITRPIKALEAACIEAEKGNLDVHVDISRNDELGKLADTFNMMFSQIQFHVDQEINTQKQKSEMQFQILQAQINPHFLYNTLDSIRWLATMQNVSSIAEMSASLINLLKYNLTSSTATTMLRDELESVKNYITIQRFRYSDAFDFAILASEEALGCKVLRFILQPLVENSIVHGFEEIEEGYILRIAAYVQEEKLHIKVIDNGAGMDEETVRCLNTEENSKHRFSNIGISNIRERIKLYFGEGYDVYYSSSLHNGTTAELVLPAIYHNAEQSISQPEGEL